MNEWLLRNCANACGREANFIIIIIIIITEIYIAHYRIALNALLVSVRNNVLQ